MTWYNVTSYNEHMYGLGNGPASMYCTSTECEEIRHTGGSGWNRRVASMVSRWNAERTCDHLPIHTDGDTVYVYADLMRSCSCGCGAILLDPALSGEDPIPDPTNLPETLRQCGACLSFVGEARETYDAYGNYERAWCNTCFLRVHSQCSDCQEYNRTSRMSRVLLNDGSVDINGDQGYRHVCGGCVSEYSLCPHCRRLYSADLGECCGEDEDIADTCTCYTCQSVRRDRDRVIQSYSYKPIPEFRSIGGDTSTRTGPYGTYDSTLYLGFELEVEVSRDEVVNAIAKRVQEGLGDVAYLKSDGSIQRGFEIVTHPMTLDYAMAKFPWRTLRDGRRDKVIYPDDNCGMHVHISRASFQNPSHEYRWLLFWHRNQEIMIMLAGRNSSYAEYNMAQRSNFKQIVTGKPAQSERYSAINTNNSTTYEVRVFESTLYVNRLKAALQLVESTAVYTRELASAKVLKDGGFSWSEYVAWLSSRENRRRYADLLGRIRDVVTATSFSTATKRHVDWPVWADNREYVSSWTSRDIITQEKV